MPPGVGSGANLSAVARQQAGIPELVAASGPLAGIENLLLQLRSGQIPPEQIMQLLALISGGGMQMGAPPMGGSPIDAAFAGGGGGGPVL